MANTAKKIKTPNFNEPEVTKELSATFRLNSDEHDLMLKIVGRTPTYTEAGIFSVMWSEHCSYKSSRFHLKKLPTEAPWVIDGPGENAGVIDIGDGQAAIFKMESHNSPSFIEPYQGAATGVGGIMRDVFTMGARPIANINALRFGEPSNELTKHIISGVVGGIAGYGNCMGVPTVGGETNFHADYNGNPLVNAMTVGIANTDKIFRAAGAGINQPVVYIGAKTGRDGIHGATMSSAEFDDESESKRPTVQVGDPFTEKLLLEACLELMKQDAIISIQDMGAAGLTSSSVEIAAKGNIGVELNLDHVPQREEMMSPYEIMLSESQERMLLILKPGKEELAKSIMEKWDIDFAVIGKTTKDQRLKINMYGKCWCDIPVPPLVDEAPEYKRPYIKSKKAEEIENNSYNFPEGGVIEALKTLMECPDLASKRWIWEQYDSLVRGETIYGSGIANTQSERAADAAIVKIYETKKALAITSDCTPRYCKANPVEGGKQAVAESYRNICATGATPLAVTNNLNFGNPEVPEIMGQFVECLEGMGKACKELNYPIVSGNVSLYNATNGNPISPTPVIGGVGLIQDINKATGIGFTSEDEIIYVIGKTNGHLGQSLFLREIAKQEKGDSPFVNLEEERKNGQFIRKCIDMKTISACHDISDGGIAVAVAEMALASNIGAKISGEDSAKFWFGEDQSRYIISTKTPEEFEKIADENNIEILKIGSTGGNEISINNNNISIKTLLEINEAWLPQYMAG